MKFMFNGIFWGTLLIILGLLVIIKVLFNVSIPIFRILFAFLLIYLGIKILIGGSCCGNKASMFCDTKIESTNTSDEYNIVFGKGTIDLSSVSLSSGSIKKEISTVFGATVIKLNPDIPTKIVVHSAFSGARMPDGNVISFGEYTYKSKNFKDTENSLQIDANVVFGSLEIM